jgi:hypothetical protein
VGRFNSDVVMQDTAVWATYFAADWKQDLPDQIHTTQIGDDGTPRWHPDFERWLTNDRLYARKNDQQRLRTTRVMRLLRKTSVREYEVMYRILVLNEAIADTTVWLNERADRNAIPFPDHRPQGPHYIEKDALALLVCGLAFAKAHW